MPIDIEDLRRRLATERSSMDDLPSKVRLLSPVALGDGEIDEIAALARLDGGSSDVVVRELRARGYLEAKPDMDPIHLERLRASAKVDPLTGLTSKGEFQRIVREWDGASRPDGSLTLCLIDMDALHRWNGELGHAAVDESIHRLASVIRRAVRDTDVVARLGGDEFVTLLPGIEGEKAVAIMDALRREFVATAAPDAAISVSVGVASRITSHTSVAQLLISADEALARSKSLGVTQIAIHDAPERRLGREDAEIAFGQ